MTFFLLNISALSGVRLNILCASATAYHTRRSIVGFWFGYVCLLLSINVKQVGFCHQVLKIIRDFLLSITAGIDLFFKGGANYFLF